MKSKETLKLELNLFNYLQKLGNYCVFECQIGTFVGGRVDCISIDTNNIVKCFELKVTKSDFHSQHGHNFIGHYNYYVMPLSLYNEVYNEVSNELPDGIGVLVPTKNKLRSVKRAKEKKCRYSIDKIKSYILRSLYREFQKNFPSQQKKLLDK